MSKKEQILYIFSDGGCHNNGKKNAKAGYSVYCKEYDIFNKTLQITGLIHTNNIGELSGIRHIFRILLKNVETFKDKKIIIVTDSKYCIDCIIKWSKNWIKNGWMNSKKEPVKNKEIIQEIVENYNSLNLDIKFKHVNSHIIEPINKKSLEWIIWNGNNICDNNINTMLNLI